MIKERDLSDLPNIGKVLKGKLREINITTVTELKIFESKDIFLKMKSIYPEICLSTLYALEGAIQGTRWHLLDDKLKEDLKFFYNSTKK